MFNQLGKYIIPGIIALGILSMFFVGKKEKAKDSLTATEEKETLKDVGIRAFKVYIFVMALVFLGIGFTPIIEWYIKALSPEILYWVNSISAILDNATLASAEITKGMADITDQCCSHGSFDRRRHVDTREHSQYYLRK